MDKSAIILVTGANKGLGYAIINAAIARQPRAHYILACRDVVAGQQAINDLRRSEPKASLELLKLDISNDDDIEETVELVSQRHGRLDVLINNAGAAIFPADSSLAILRAAYSDSFDINVSSVACMCAAFKPLLHRSERPKVINVTSGLGSITNALTKKMHRLPTYGTSKVALNGLTAHLQTEENDRVAAQDPANASDPKIDYFVVAPGLLKTALSRFSQHGKDPAAGTEVVIQLMLSNQYPGGTQWEYESGRMQEVPW